MKNYRVVCIALLLMTVSAAYAGEVSIVQNGSGVNSPNIVGNNNVVRIAGRDARAADPYMVFRVLNPGVERNSFATKVKHLKVHGGYDGTAVQRMILDESAGQDGIIVEIAADADAALKAALPQNSCNSNLSCEQAIEEMCRWLGHSGRKKTTPVTLAQNQTCSGQCVTGHLASITCVIAPRPRGEN